MLRSPMIKSRNYYPLKVNIVIQVVNDAFDGNDWYEMEKKKRSGFEFL